MKPVGHIALHPFVTLFCVMLVLCMPYLRVLKFYIWVPDEKIADPFLFFFFLFVFLFVFFLFFCFVLFFLSGIFFTFRVMPPLKKKNRIKSCQQCV